MHHPSHRPGATPAYGLLLLLLLAAALLLGGCGGGGSATETAPAPATIEGSRDTSRSLISRASNTVYPLNVYLPPASAGPRSGLPVIYALDGDTWFDVLVNIAETTRSRVIIVGIGNSAARNRDYVPANSCTLSGGGQAAYFDFIRQELIPYVEAQIGGDPARRVLLGHSHGGSFVFYALFAQAPGQHMFSAYLASDASLGCMPDTAAGWEQSYASAYRQLPVRLHVSYATQGNYSANLAYARVIADRHYERLSLKSQAYDGSHTGIIPAAFADAVGFAIAASP